MGSWNSGTASTSVIIYISVYVNTPVQGKVNDTEVCIIVNRQRLLLRI